MTIFLTGASGFIGKYVIKALRAQGHDIIALSREAQTNNNAIKWIKGSLSELQECINLVKLEKTSACIHLAWEGIPDYSSRVSIKNLKYGLDILGFCKLCDIENLIMTGSCWEYSNPIGAVTEESKLSYENGFKAAKNTLHIMAETFCKENFIRLQWLRLFYVYGKGQRKNSLIPYIAQELYAGRVPKLNGANNRNDFIHAYDVGRAICYALNNKNQRDSINIGSGKPVMVKEIAQYMAQLLHIQYNDEEKLILPEPETPSDFWADITHAQDSMHWTPQITIEEGIQDYLNFLEVE